LGFFNCSQFTVNLSSFPVSDASISLLNKGLTFIPTITSFPEKEINEAASYIERSLLLKDFFHNRPSDFDPGHFSKMFVKRSTWMPPRKAISTATLSTINNMREATDKKLARIRYNACNSTRIQHKNITDNLTAAERRALTEIRNNSDIIVKPADKGGAVVIMDRKLYIAEGMRQLSDPIYYKELDTAIFPESVGLINELVQQLLNKKFINDRQYEFLKATPNSKQRHFYLLPKIHKDFNKWPNSKMPQGRPIVADCSSESYNISSYIDYWLQPLAVSHEAYIKDTYDFVEKIRDVEVCEKDLLVTGDVTSLYTNMKIDLILLTVQEAFNETPNPARPDTEILQLLELTLKRNDFEFNDRIFLQICGTAMGKTYAPSLANMYLKKFDKAAKYGFRINPKLYWRFLDDIYLIWPGSRQELAEYQDFLNSIIDGIKVELKARDRIIEFLDTQVYKDLNADGRWVLKTKPFFKPTDTHQLLHAKSFHPRHTTRGILKSQFIRFKRIASSLEDYNEAARTLGAVLSKRGYSSRIFRRLKLDVWHHFDIQRKKETRKSEEQILPIITRYDRVQSSLNHEWRPIILKNPIFDDFRKIAAFKIHKNLRQYLVSNRLCKSTAHTVQQSATGTDRENINILASLCRQNELNKISKCRHPLCKCCRHITETDIIYVPHIGYSIDVHANMNCNSRNVVYIIICARCGKAYIGETKSKLKDRLNKHRSDVGLHRNLPVSQHFYSAGHTVAHLRIFPLEQIATDDDNLRRLRESFWIKKLNTRYPLGLNIYPHLGRQ